MTKVYFLVAALFFTIKFTYAQNENVGIGTLTPHPSAVLELAADDKGLLVPSLSTLQRIGIQNPEDGLLVYDQDLHQFWYYNEDISDWMQASGAQTGDWAGICIYNSANHANVGIPCDHLMKSPVTGIQQCLSGWTWINISASSQNSGSANTNHWTGACIKD